MTVDLEQDPTSPASQPTPSGVRSSVWNHVRTPGMPRGVLYIVAAALGVAIWFLFDGQADNSRRDLERERAANDADIARIEYQARVDLAQSDIARWVQDSATFAVCLDSVTRSDNNRGQWITLVEILRAPDVALDVYADQLEAGPLLSSTPRKTTDCVDPGPQPTLPTQPTPSAN